MAESPGFTGLGTPSFPGFPVSPIPGQCIISQPWLRALTHCVAFPLAFALAYSPVSALRLPIGNPLLLGLLLGVGGEVGLLVRLIHLALTVVVCMVVSLAITDPAPVVLRRVLPERERWVPDFPWLFALLGSNPVPSGPILPMVPHVVRHKREEMGLLVILLGPCPVVLASSTTILCGVGCVLLDLLMMAVALGGLVVHDLVDPACGSRSWR